MKEELQTVSGPLKRNKIEDFKVCRFCAYKYLYSSPKY